MRYNSDYMNLILLPGNNKSDRVWIDEMDREFSPHFTRTALQYYDHWWSGDDEAILDMDAELIKLTSIVQEFDKYVIFAKSAGVLLALYGVYEGVLDPEVCIFVGSAIEWGKKERFDVDNWLTNYSVPTLFIQKEFDPAISFEDLKKYLELKNVTSYELAKLPGDDHQYDEVESLAKLTMEFYDL
jgi:pimeloyl-ACP methyl ester carboxylesterase